MYGLGWHVQGHDDTTLIWHGGRWPPSVSALYLKVPNAGLTFIALANTTNLSTPYPMADGDVLHSTLALTFYREFVLPRLHGTEVPRIDWDSPESDLVSQLEAVTDEQALRHLERELWSYRMVHFSVGRIEDVHRLERVHQAVFPATTRLNPSLFTDATAGPAGRAIELSPAELAPITGSYVFDATQSQWPDGLPTAPPALIQIEAERGSLQMCADEQYPLTMTPITRDTFYGVGPNGYAYLDAQFEGDGVANVSLQLAPTINLVYEPMAAGLSSAGLAEAASIAQEVGSAALLALHDDDVSFSWGEPDAKLPIHSIRKPLIGALYGIHVESGEIDLDATMEELGIDDIPPALTPEEKQATVRQLLTSTSGVYHPAAAEAAVMIETRPQRGSHPPGTFYYYNNWDFNVLGTIFEQQTGMGVCEAFRIEIAEVIGMEDFSAEDCSYQLEPEKSMHPSYPISMTSRDLARFGLLYLRGGEWDGDQVVPEWWIDESWSAHATVDAEEGIGRGYLWNVVSTDGDFGRAVGHEMYYHTGVGVHFLGVIPGMDLVLVHRMDTTGPFTDPGERLADLLGAVIRAHL
jgi:CubicO group peptidase (beta-lactamase class C family)